MEYTFKEVTKGYVVVQPVDGTIMAYKDDGSGEPTGDVVYMSDVVAATQKQFEVETAYITVYDIQHSELFDESD